MAMPHTSSGPDPVEKDPIQALNDESRQSMERILDKQRRMLIDTSFKAAQRLWERQEDRFGEIAAAGYPEDAEYEYEVTVDYTGFPFEDEKPVASLKFVVAPKSKEESKDQKDQLEGEQTEEKMVEEDQSQMAVYIPAPEGTVFDENLDVDALPKPDRVAYELTMRNGQTMNLIVSQMGTQPFVNARDSGEDVLESDVLEPEDIASAEQAVPSDAELIPLLQRNLTDWKAQVQLRNLVREMNWLPPEHWD